MDKVQADHLRRFPFIEVAPNRIPHIGVELFQGIRLGENRFPERLGRVASIPTRTDRDQTMEDKVNSVKEKLNND